MAGSRLDDAAVDLYRSLLRDRLASSSCSRCGHSLAGAAIEAVEGSAPLGEHQLSDRGLAQLHAATDYLQVHCPGCHSLVDLGIPSRPVAPAQVPPALEPPLSDAARAIYASDIRGRLLAARCGSCLQGLGDATLLSTSGGTSLDEYGLTDESIAHALAATQHLNVRCGRCGHQSVVCDTCGRCRTTR